MDPNQRELTPFEKGRIFLVDKPYTWTSFQVVNKLRYLITRAYGLKKLKIGHAGTLDPLATGLLIICTGKYTKRIEEFQAEEKEYTGTFTIGATTPCYDMEKPVDQTYPTDHITNAMIEDVRQSFLGEQWQTPPVFSAVKIDGKRAYDYARQDEEVKMKERLIEVKAFEITRIELPEIDFRIVCSKGTYIRSIARDFGEKLHSGAYLSRLCRTRIGRFELKDALALDAWTAEAFLEAGENLV